MIVILLGIVLAPIAFGLLAAGVAAFAPFAIRGGGLRRFSDEPRDLAAVTIPIRDPGSDAAIETTAV